MRKQIRYLKEMEKVVFDRDFAKENPDLEVYYTERGLEKKDSLRYDITVIPPRMLGKEFVRTKGHYHSNDFQELYVILEGEAIFFLQKGQPASAKATEGKGKIEDVIVIKAEKGDWVLVPTGYAHITINPSKKGLKIGNWVSEKCENLYKPLEKMDGPCYFYTTEGWIKNKNYKEVPELRFEKPLKERPKSLDFLKG